jgi:MYXO-CTERM domain-containing protein
MPKLLALATLFVSGLLLAGVVATAGSADTTTETTTQSSTEQVTTTTVQQTTTAPATTVVTTATVAPPTTAPTTTATASTSSGTPTWGWALLGLFGIALIGLLIYLFTRNGPAAISDAERRRRLQAAIDSWTAQGWALLSESAETAVLQRGNERMTVTVDPTGHITTNTATPQQPGQPPDRWPE